MVGPSQLLQVLDYYRRPKHQHSQLIPLSTLLHPPTSTSMTLSSLCSPLDELATILDFFGESKLVKFERSLTIRQQPMILEKAHPSLRSQDQVNIRQAKQTLLSCSPKIGLCFCRNSFLESRSGLVKWDKNIERKEKSRKWKQEGNEGTKGVIKGRKFKTTKS